MWITIKMSDDIDEKITWNPKLGTWLETLEDLHDALSEAGYRLDISKLS